MLRDCNIEDISDGRRYELNDMVKADTHGCAGCFKCCCNAGSSIVLDAYDVHMLKLATKRSFQGLLDDGRIELNIVDGLILPNIKMDDRNRCSFLDASGRCSIHDSRPGICRLFPLGRIYEDDSFSYFLQTKECVYESRSKIKVKKWIDIADIKESSSFILNWHIFVKQLGKNLRELRDSGRSEHINDITMYVLNEFFVKDIVTDDNIYDYLNSKIEEAGRCLKPLIG